MSLMMTEIYDAFRAANVSEEQARRAAEAVAGYENRFQNIERDLTLLKWMVGTNVALSIGVLLRVLF